MGKLFLSLSMSLDGFITGPDPRAGEPLGDGGERLHEWMAGMAGPEAPATGDGGSPLFGRRCCRLGSRGKARLCTL